MNSKKNMSLKRLTLRSLSKEKDVEIIRAEKNNKKEKKTKVSKLQTAELNQNFKSTNSFKTINTEAKAKFTSFAIPQNSIES